MDTLYFVSLANQLAAQAESSTANKLIDKIHEQLSDKDETILNPIIATLDIITNYMPM